MTEQLENHYEDNHEDDHEDNPQVPSDEISKYAEAEMLSEEDNSTAQQIGGLRQQIRGLVEQIRGQADTTNNVRAGRNGNRAFEGGVAGLGIALLANGMKEDVQNTGINIALPILGAVLMLGKKENTFALMDSTGTKEIFSFSTRKNPLLFGLGVTGRYDINRVESSGVTTDTTLFLKKNGKYKIRTTENGRTTTDKGKDTTTVTSNLNKIKQYLTSIVEELQNGSTNVGPMNRIEKST